MTAYIDEIKTNKKFKTNVVIQIGAD